MSEKSFELRCIFRIDKGPANGAGATHGWQVRVRRDRKHHSKMFSDSIFGDSATALAVAKEFRDTLLVDLGIEAGTVIADRLPRNNTSGILGVNRSESIDSSAWIKEVWQTTFPAPDGSVQTRSFNISRYGEIGALFRAVEARMEGLCRLVGTERYIHSRETIRVLVDKYLNILVYLDGVSQSEAEILVKTLNDKSIPNTAKEEVVTGRVGHGSYRDKLLRLWNSKCSVTGARHLLNASHVKPWAAASPSERLDPFNGLLLCPQYDKAFDVGLITFDINGRIVIHPELDDADKLGISSEALLTSVNPLTMRYMDYHRDFVFGIRFKADADGSNNSFKPT